jgi:hypothetical protein
MDPGQEEEEDRTVTTKGEIDQKPTKTFQEETAQ